MGHVCQLAARLINPITLNEWAQRIVSYTIITWYSSHFMHDACFLHSWTCVAYLLRQKYSATTQAFLQECTSLPSKTLLVSLLYYNWSPPPQGPSIAEYLVFLWHCRWSPPPRPLVSLDTLADEVGPSTGATRYGCDIWSRGLGDHF